jgi:UDP-N-acetylmuramoyl-tripeptide--D-alanyl-D-alanine ligase
MIQMTIDEIYKVFKSSNGVCTDTRQIRPNDLFIALKGPNFNANEFASKAIDLGACFAIIDDPAYATEKTILVSDGLSCLQDLARLHRSKLNYPIIGLTGSNGKTTTKELISSVLSQMYKVRSTSGNLNNHIGVALTVLSFDSNLDFGIIEMGANHQKEIEFLCTIAQPDFGLITNFGKAHLEGFGGVEGVIKGKSELYDFIRNNGKTAFINGDDPKQIKQIGNYENVVTFGTSYTVDYRIRLLSSDPYVKLQYKNELIESHLIGEYNFGNIAVAIAIGAHFELAPEKIKKGIENYQPDNNRSEILKKGSNQVILDAYNANPTSMLAALKSFSKLEAANKYLFLGDMFELGEDSAMEHQAIVDYVEAHFEKHLYFIGSHFYNTTTNDPSVKFKSFEEAIDTIRSLSPENAHVFIKGSRGMALERLVDYLNFR